jgi:osmoprotectant transport system ATP-binding protein
VEPPAVSFVNISASRGGRTVLHDVSLTVGARETVALVGRSGSGKTTLLRLVNRLLDRDAGRLLVNGRDVGQWDPIDLRRRTGYVIQGAGLFPHMTVAGNIAVVPSLLRWDQARIGARVDELLVLVGLDPSEFRSRWPDELSGGQQQRVGLARALAANPPLLLMDEPFGALDPITKKELHAEFKRIRGDSALSPDPGSSAPFAAIIVTHDIAEAFHLADRVAVLHEGRIIAAGTRAELEAAPDARVVALVKQ